MEEISVGPIRKFFLGSIKRKLLFSFLITALIPLIILTYSSHSISENLLLESALDNMGTNVRFHSGEINAMLNSYSDEVLFFSKTPSIEGIISGNKSNSSLGAWKYRLGKMFFEAATYNEGYLQMRYIDEYGDEIVRVNSENGKVTIVDETLLQNKKDRYYFQESIILNEGEIYISQLDLNKEGDPPKVELPYNPVIRYATPVVDDEGKKRGIIILNILGNHILKSFHSKSNETNIKEQLNETEILIDFEGYYLSHSSKEKEWGGPNDLNTGENIQKDYLGILEELNSGKEGIIHYKNEFVSHYPIFLGDTSWTVIQVVPKEVILVPLNKLKNLFILGGAIFILAIIIISFRLSKSLSKPIGKLFSATKKLEEGDYSARVDIDAIDEMGDLGKSFNKTIQSLEGIEQEHRQVDKAKTDFLSITSHELRSPMTPMRAQLQMMLSNYFGKLNAQQKESLEIVLRNTIRLDNIIQDFLEISRIEAARLKFRFTKSNLKSNLKNLIKEMEGFMPEKKIKLNAEFAELPIIEVDPDRVMQILRNLINNAKKFSKQDGTIDVKSKLQENYILFSVKDNGIGINQVDQSRLFDPFFQAEQTMYREHQGTGLGLAIVKGIVESQGGKVWLESDFGRGTTFFFTVPLIPVKNIQPIKLLFSEEKDIEIKILNMFKEFLGPMGEKEFYLQKKQEKINKKDIVKYINLILKEKIISDEKAQLFKGKILGLYGELPIKGSEMEETTAGFFKRGEL